MINYRNLEGLGRLQ